MGIYRNLATVCLYRLFKMHIEYLLPIINNPVLTLGTFDGVHLGHQKLINFLNESARTVNGESVLFTFHPHPRIVLHPDDHNLELIQTIEKRIEKLYIGASSFNKLRFPSLLRPK